MISNYYAYYTELITMRIGTTEIILLLCLALVIFGGNRISGIGKALGTSIREFKKEVKSSDDLDAESTAQADQGPAESLKSVAEPAEAPKEDTAKEEAAPKEEENTIG